MKEFVEDFKILYEYPKELKNDSQRESVIFEN